MEILRPSLGPLLRIWWLRTWRGVGAGMAAVAPFALGFYLLERAGVSPGWFKYLQQALIVLIGAAIAFWVSRTALTKRYSDFRIAFLPLGADGPELPLTNRHVVRFWWFLVWRVTLGAAVITVAGELAKPWLPSERAEEVIVALAILAWEFLVLRQALTRRYRDFRIVLVAETLPDAAAAFRGSAGRPP